MHSSKYRGVSSKQQSVERSKQQLRQRMEGLAAAIAEESAVGSRE